MHLANRKREAGKVVGLREPKDTPVTKDTPVAEAPLAPLSRDESQKPATAAARPAAKPSRQGRATLRATLMLGGILAVAAACAVMWLRGGRYVSTDNSYVRAAKLMVSTDVSGIVATVSVRQGDIVEAGRELFRLDARQFEIALAAAMAQRDQASLNIEAAQKDYQRIRSDIAAQGAAVSQARTAFYRASALVSRNAGSQAASDQTRFALAAEDNKLKSLQQAAQVALTRLGGVADKPVTAHPQYMEAEARVAETRRQLERTIVRAPFAGTVTSVESLQPGTFLVAATAALTNTGAVGLIANENVWIEANMKETDLTHARAGNPVEIVIDAYPGRVWKGRIESIFPATASEFSILPAQNAGGNWVKVVQRIPVRISVERQPGEPPLRAGMSTVITVDTGHRRTMRDLWALFGITRPPVDLGFVDGIAHPRAAP
jgi:membrane fusion protein (multidrug efflux system)